MGWADVFSNVRLFSGYCNGIDFRFSVVYGLFLGW